MALNDRLRRLPVLQTSSFYRYRDIENWRATTTNPPPSTSYSDTTIFTPAESIDGTPTTPTQLQLAEVIDWEAWVRGVVSPESQSSSESPVFTPCESIDDNPISPAHPQPREGRGRHPPTYFASAVNRSLRKQLQATYTRMDQDAQRLRELQSSLIIKETEVQEEGTRYLERMHELELKIERRARSLERLQDLDSLREKNNQLQQELDILKGPVPDAPIFTGEYKYQLPKFITACKSRFNDPSNKSWYSTEERKMDYIISRLRGAPRKHYEWRLDEHGRLLLNMAYGTAEGVFNYLRIFFGPLDNITWLSRSKFELNRYLGT